MYVFMCILGYDAVPLQSAHLDGATQITTQLHEYFYECIYVYMYSMCVCICVCAGRWCGAASEHSS